MYRLGNLPFYFIPYYTYSKLHNKFIKINYNNPKINISQTAYFNDKFIILEINNEVIKYEKYINGYAFNYIDDNFNPCNNNIKLLYFDITDKTKNIDLSNSKVKYISSHIKIKNINKHVKYFMMSYKITNINNISENIKGISYLDSLSINDITNFKNLKYLGIYGNIDQYPESLKYLSIKIKHPSLIINLPKNLISLSIELYTGIPYKICSIPSNLIYLRIISNDSIENICYIFSENDFNKLKYLEFGGDIVIDFNIIPNTVKYLRLGNFYINTKIIPKNIKELCLSSRIAYDLELYHDLDTLYLPNKAYLKNIDMENKIKKIYRYYKCNFKTWY